jgi:hypothetical protein
MPYIENLDINPPKKTLAISSFPSSCQEANLLDLSFEESAPLPPPLPPRELRVTSSSRNPFVTEFFGRNQEPLRDQTKSSDYEWPPISPVPLSTENDPKENKNPFRT